MIKVIGVTLLTCMALLPFRANAHTVNLKLAPKESKLITNSYMWTLNATCTIQTNESAKKIAINVLKNSSKVNGRQLATGQKTSVTVHNNDNIQVSAEPGAQVTLHNLGKDLVVASCSA